MAAELLDANRQALALALRKTDTNNSSISAARLEMMKAESRFYSLRRRQKALRREEATAVQRYSQSWCQSFSQGLLGKLPRELRDVVYDYLLPTSATALLQDHDWRITPSFGATFSSQDPYDLDDESIHHYLTSEFMGTSFQKECLEKFHLRAQFRIDNADEVQKFLENGLPLETLPLRAFDFVCPLTVQISFQAPENYDKRRWFRSGEHSFKLYIKGEEPERLESVATKHEFKKKALLLAGIANIKQLNKLELYISIRTWIHRAARGFEKALVPFVHDLRDHGAKVDGEFQPYRHDFRRNIEMYPGWKCDFTRPESW